MSVCRAEISRLRERIADLEAQPTVPAGLGDALDAAQRHLRTARHLADTDTTPNPARPPAAPTSASKRPSAPAPRPVSTPAVPVDGAPTSFRAGAERMLTALGRMAPLRLTRTQWGTVAKMKATGGTFSTYLGELRRAGLIEENTAGFTLTAAGFAHIGGQPAPLTASAGTFSTYLGELRRNGLITVDRGHIRATDILIHGAHTDPRHDHHPHRRAHTGT